MNCIKVLTKEWLVLFQYMMLRGFQDDLRYIKYKTRQHFMFM